MIIELTYDHENQIKNSVCIGKYIIVTTTLISKGISNISCEILHLQRNIRGFLWAKKGERIGIAN